MTRIHLVSGDVLSGMTVAEKVRFILDEVKADKIVILQEGLAPEEEIALVERTMHELVPGGFAGIDVETHPAGPARGPFARFFRAARRGRLTVVSPADRMRTLAKTRASLETWIRTRDNPP